MAKSKDWRDDPAWRLVFFNPALFTATPGHRPHDKAELAQPGNWASLYHENRIAATWSRLDPSLA